MTSTQRMKKLVGFAQTRTQSWYDSLEKFSLNRLGIVGAGVMGTAIAAQAAARGLLSILFDIDAEALARSQRQTVELLVDHHGFTSEEALDIADRFIQTTNQPHGLFECEVVIESTPEVPAIKEAVFSTIEPVLHPGAILGSNTSTIPIERLAPMLQQPGRLCGLHFFHPVGQRPLVEIIRSKQTEDRTVAGALAVAIALGRPAICVGDSPGFVVNRLLLPYLTEAMELLLDRVPIERIESAARSFGMAKGPLEMIDEIGLDTILHGGRVLWETWPDRITVSPLLIPMYKKRLFGLKTRAGFFLYTADGEKTGQIHPTTRELIDYWTRSKKDGAEAMPEQITDEQIIDRLFHPMADEAKRLLAEGVVTDPRDIELAALFGLGFPEQHVELLV